MPDLIDVIITVAKCGWLGVMFLKTLVVYEATYAKTTTSQKGTFLSARLCKMLFIVAPFVPHVTDHYKYTTVFAFTHNLTDLIPSYTNLWL